MVFGIDPGAELHKIENAIITAAQVAILKGTVKMELSRLAELDPDKAEKYAAALKALD